MKNGPNVSYVVDYVDLPIQNLILHSYVSYVSLAQRVTWVPPWLGESHDHGPFTFPDRVLWRFCRATGQCTGFRLNAIFGQVLCGLSSGKKCHKNPWISIVVSPARWGSLDFNKGATHPPSHSLLVTPDAAGHAWIWMLSREWMQWGTPGPELHTASAECNGAWTRTHARMPDRMSEYMPECQIECQHRCQIECQKEYQIESQNRYAIYTSRWYVRNYVRIVCQSGDHSNKVVFLGIITGWWFQPLWKNMKLVGMMKFSIYGK